MRPKQAWRRNCVTGLAVLALAGCMIISLGTTTQVRITGAEEVPPVNTSAQGSGTFTVNRDKTVSGRFSVSGLTPIAAHIHEGSPGQNGPIIITLTRNSDSDWVVPNGAKLTEAQYSAYRAARLYVNFHTTQHKGGEVRGQISPAGGPVDSSGY